MLWVRRWENFRERRAAQPGLNLRQERQARNKSHGWHSNLHLTLDSVIARLIILISHLPSMWTLAARGQPRRWSRESTYMAMGNQYNLPCSPQSRCLKLDASRHSISAKYDLGLRCYHPWISLWLSATIAGSKIRLCGSPFSSKLLKNHGRRWIAFWKSMYNLQTILQIYRFDDYVKNSCVRKSVALRRTTHWIVVLWEFFRVGAPLRAAPLLSTRARRKRQRTGRRGACPDWEDEHGRPPWL